MPIVRAAVAWILAFACAPSSEAGERDAVSTWTRWEHVLTAAGDYPNPYASPTVAVTYRGPGGESIKGYGFWDGEKVFKIRCMFSRPGTWTWRTACSQPGDAGLHDRSGAVEVSPYEGDNSLFRRGYLRVEPGRRHLTHADGTPFLWIGDTAWAMPMFALLEDWQTYVNDRCAKRFSVIQIFCASEWAGTKDAQGNAPFTGEGLERWNPAYWQAYERKIAYANAQGLVVAIVGLMEPVKRYPDEASAKLFARNLAARLMGDFVVFSPSFDSVYKELGDAVAYAARDAAPFHLITQHPGTDLPAAIAYHGKPMLDFAGFQSGAGWGSSPLSPAIASRNAIEWTLKLRRLAPRRPVINLESRYDSEFNQGQLPRTPRSCGYLTFLSGAAGYTYGCAGVWNGGTAFVGKDPQASAWDWRRGIEQPSSTEMRHMAELLGGIDWWRLRPRHDLIADQEKDWLRHMALAATAEGDLAVAYLPDNSSITIVGGAFPRAMRPRWFNPADGRTIAGEKPAEESAVELMGKLTFDRPAGWGDAVLVLEAQRWAPAKIAISRETTHVLGPLDDEGFIDYVGALREKCTQGVTPENNLVVALWQAIGPGPLPLEADFRQRFFEDLGIEPLPEEGEYLRPLVEFVPQEERDELSEGEDVTGKLQQAREECRWRPWSKEEFPSIAAWLAASERPLDRIVKATKECDRFYYPCIPEGYLEVSSDPSLLVSDLRALTTFRVREIASMLAARAMARAYARDVDGACSDILACHRLSRHIAQGPFTLDAVMSANLEMYASIAGNGLAATGAVSGERAKVFLAELRSLPAFSPLAHSIDTGERLAGLAALVAYARAPFEFVLRTLDAMGGSKPASPQARDSLAQVPVDWNEPLKDFNRTVSALVQAARAERYSERAKESARYERQLEARVDGVSAEFEALKSRGDWQPIKERMVTAPFIVFLAPRGVEILKCEGKRTAVADLACLTWALAAYHADKGEYPEGLSGLTPGYLPSIPQDVFTGRGFRYSRTHQGYLVYSAGPNQKDDGGGVIGEARDNDDIGFRIPIGGPKPEGASR